MANLASVWGTPAPGVINLYEQCVHMYAYQGLPHKHMIITAEKHSIVYSRETPNQLPMFPRAMYSALSTHVRNYNFDNMDIHALPLVSCTRPLPPQLLVYCTTSRAGEGVVWYTRLALPPQ